MPHVSASRELLAPLDDVWAFVAEPYNLPNWWPRLGGVEPDRRGFAPGARWLVTGENRPSLLRRPEAVGHLLVLAVEPKRRFAFQLTGDRLDVELRLEPAGEDADHGDARDPRALAGRPLALAPEPGAQPPARPVPDCG